MTLRLLIISYIVTIAKYVEITTIHGTRKIVKKNIILDNIKYVAISALGKSIVETVLLFSVCFVNFSICLHMNVRYYGIKLDPVEMRYNVSLNSDSYLLVYLTLNGVAL